MIITINLLTVLKWYLIGSLVSVIIITFTKEMEKSPSNYLRGILGSWIILVVPLYYFKEWLLKILSRKLNTYNFLVLKSLLNFKYNKGYILQEYFITRFREKRLYNKRDVKFLDYEDYITWRDEFEWRFIRRYK